MPVVYYGTESGSYSYVKTVLLSHYVTVNFTPYELLQAVTSTYNASDMCDSPATDWGWREPGLLHTVVMDKLVINSLDVFNYHSITQSPCVCMACLPSPA